MIFIPVTATSLVFWIQDSFLKGDKHMDQRRIEQEELRKKLARERRERLYNMGQSNKQVNMAENEVTEESQDEDGNIIIKKKKSINRQIEEGLYLIQDEDYNPDGSFHQAAAVGQGMDDLDYDPDAFDQLIEEQKKIKRAQTLKKQESRNKID